MRPVGNVVLFLVPCCHANDWVRGSVVAFTTPVVPVDLRTSPSSRATNGSIFEVWPFLAARAMRSTSGPPPYWKTPNSDFGLMIVLVLVAVPGELTHS